jgi:hypothetical protein
MKFLQSAILIFLVAFNVNSQSLARFESDKLNFGYINDDSGILKHSFEFQNVGSKKLQIDTITVNCSCISLTWSQNIINPTEKGNIDISLNPEGLSGAIEKVLRVSYKNEDRIDSLKLIGMVKPGINNPEKYFKKKIGGIRFRSNYLSMGSISLDSIYEKDFQFYNDSDTIITFLEQIGHAKHLEIDITPMSLKPGEIGSLHVKYDASINGELGPMSDVITLVSDENNRYAMKYLSIAAEVKYKFPEMTEEEEKNSANIKFSKTDHNFGQMIEGVIGTVEFPFTNTGKSDLKIIQTSTSCGCTAGVADKETYAPDETGAIEISFDSRNRPGKNSKYITIYTNSPANPVVRLKITAEVASDVPETE